MEFILQQHIQYQQTLRYVLLRHIGTYHDNGMHR